MTNVQGKTSSDTTLFLAHTSGEPDEVNAAGASVARANAAGAHNERAFWMFLGRSYTELLAWDHRLDDSSKNR